jgi:hypothetical protein
MLVRFSSVKTGSVLMFGEVAVTLIRMMGATGKVPGAIGAEDVPAALSRLQLQLKASAMTSEGAAASADKQNDKDSEPKISLAMRAGPLIQILERAAAAGVAVMWEEE